MKKSHAIYKKALREMRRILKSRPSVESATPIELSEGIKNSPALMVVVNAFQEQLRFNKRVVVHDYFDFDEWNWSRIPAKHKPKGVLAICMWDKNHPGEIHIYLDPTHETAVASLVHELWHALQWDEYSLKEHLRKGFVGVEDTPHVFTCACLPSLQPARKAPRREFHRADAAWKFMLNNARGFSYRLRCDLIEAGIDWVRV